jgi:hypothetical protein
MSLEKNIHDDGSIVVGQAQGFAWPFTTVAAWQGGDFYSVLGQNAMAIATEAGLKPDGESHFGDDVEVAWTNLFYRLSRQVDADKAAALFADPEKIAKPYARLVRVYSAAKSDMIPVGNFDNTFTVPKLPFGGRGEWQPFGLITLPSIVWAYANAMDWEVPDLNFAEISDAKNMLIRPEEVATVWNRLVEQRAALWAALGEENYKCQTPMGSIDKRTNLPIIGATTSDKLSKALNFAMSRWENMFAAVGVVGNPSRKGARVPVVNHLFEDLAAATAFVAERATGNTTEEDVVTMPKVAANPYAGLYVVDGLTVDDMAQAVASSMVELSAKLDSTANVVEKGKVRNEIKAQFASDFGVDAETGNAFEWIAKLKENGVL